MAESIIITIASSVISSALNSLATLARDEINFLRDVPKNVQLIEAMLRAIQSYLRDSENKPQKSHFTKNWLLEMKRVTYQAQDAIERVHHLSQRHPNRSRVSRYLHTPGYLKDLHRIGEEIIEINKFIPEISRLRNNLNVVNLGASSMADQFEDQQFQDPRNTIYINDEDDVIGFECEIKKVIKILQDPTYKPLKVVSLVGMGGIGKTTLAKKVSNHSEIKNYFDIIALVTVSKEYNVLNLQKEILKATKKYEDEVLEEMTKEKVRENLLSEIKEKKYLIVVDDIWETKSWDEINDNNTTFPNKHNGSRILMTTRKGEVAGHPNFRCELHHVKYLNNEESLKLFKKKALPPYVVVSESIKKELESLCSQLIKKCNGLPLALIVLGGYLSKHLDDQIWSEMVKSVDWNKAGNQIDISNILALSYYDLPTDLKPAFLYITIFPEDHIVECADLVRLWIAEGFVPYSRNYNLETIAQDYVDQLNERGLVQVVQRSRVHGRINRIRIHDVLRDWGIKKAKEEEFFHVVKNSDDVNHCDAHYSYRVALHGYCDKDKVNSISNLRTMLGFELSRQSEDLFRGLKSLRVISFTHKEHTIKSPEYMKHTILLRYICLQKCEDVHFPSSIGELYNLETLECKKSKIMSLPNSLWEISNLRHVHLQSICCNWNGPKKGSGQNLQTLIIYEWRVGSLQKTIARIYTGMGGVAVAVEDMKRIVQLQLDSYIHPLPENLLSKISGLDDLEVLELLNPIKGLTKIPRYTFPPNILKLTLRCDELVEDPMPILQKLHKLVELSLSCGDQLQHMYCSGGGFPRLKYLSIRSFSVLEDWTIGSGVVMPSLCHLALSKCNKLKEFPRGLMEHDQLQLLKLYSVRHLCKVDYSNLKKKGCKVEIIEPIS